MSVISKNTRIIETNIADKDGRICNLLKHLSSQLSDGYWENEEGYFEEYWNWLDFRNFDGGLQIIVKSKPTWDNYPDIFSKMSDTDVVHYVANVLDNCYDDAGSDVFMKYIDIIDKVLSVLFSYPQTDNANTEDKNPTVKSRPFCDSDNIQEMIIKMSTTKTITVKVKYETEVEIDITDLSSEFVDVNGFAYEEAYRMITDDLEHGYVSANDMEFEIIKKK